MAFEQMDLLSNCTSLLDDNIIDPLSILNEYMISLMRFLNTISDIIVRYLSQSPGLWNTVFEESK